MQSLRITLNYSRLEMVDLCFVVSGKANKLNFLPQHHYPLNWYRHLDVYFIEDSDIYILYL